ncbi:MAG: hypothetical protein AAF487_02170 [Bacteroidota bacterium]
MTETAVGELLVNSLFNAVSKSFEDVVGLLNDEASFEEKSEIDPEEGYPFLLITLTGNICFIPKYFDSGQDKRIIEYIISYASDVLQIEKKQLAQDISECKKQMSRINYPSKNTVYAMSKAVFYRYDLNEYQEKYFQTLRVPNPKFLQHMDEVNKLFIFNWKALFEKYKVVEK